MKNYLIQFSRNLTVGCALLVLLQVSQARAQTGAPIKNIVIVHGAFTDASGWEPVYQILTKDGYNVSLVQNPLTSLQDDVDATNRILDRQQGRAILVGHSWGGAVITEAGASAKVAGLVYVAAFMPDVNESAISLIRSGPQLAVNGILAPDKNGLLYFDKDKFRACFAAEQTASKAAFMADSQQPIAVKSFLTPVTTAAWKIKPTYAIVATEDKSISPDLERKMYKHAGAKVTEVSSSHTVYLANPAAVAAVIETAARATVQKQN